MATVCKSPFEKAGARAILPLLSQCLETVSVSVHFLYFDKISFLKSYKNICFILIWPSIGYRVEITIK